MKISTYKLLNTNLCNFSKVALALLDMKVVHVFEMCLFTYIEKKMKCLLQSFNTT